VTVTVSRSSSDAEYERLPETLRTRITEDAGRPVTVNVRFIDYHQSSPAAAGGSAGPGAWLAETGRERRTSLARAVGPTSTCPFDGACRDPTAPARRDAA
jgi:hypothetical protein